jgi:predicted alpha/beta hydrolase
MMDMLSARCYSAPKPVANIIVAGATGVPQEFYRRFAQYVAPKRIYNDHI